VVFFAAFGGFGIVDDFDVIAGVFASFAFSVVV